MIQRDSLSDALTIFAVAAGLYLSTFDLGFLSLFLVTLPIAGIALQLYLVEYKIKKQTHVSVPLSRRSLSSVGFYVIVGFAAILGVGLAAPYVDKLPFLAQIRLETAPATLLVSVIAIGEEQFFRGFFANWLVLNSKSTFFAILGTTAIFSAFHFAVYGSKLDALFYVLAAGVVLTWLGFVSGKLLVCQLIHIINNVVTYLVVVPV